jgi:carboxymethylenebutenolidase
MFQALSRTEGSDRVVDELLIRFTHDLVMDTLLPGVPATVKRVELPLVVVVGFQDGKVGQ